MSARAWELASRQHGVVARRQLIHLGFHSQAIKHRRAKGRLHPVYRGVYAVGRPDLTREGRWMAAVLACGPDAYLSHQSAATLWQILPERRTGPNTQPPIHVSLKAAVVHRAPGIRVHRRRSLTDADITIHRGIPVTRPTRTLLDLATALPTRHLERAVNEADKHDLVDPETLREELEARKGKSGVRPLRALLDRQTFPLTDSELERWFLPIVRRAGLPLPQTQVRINGHRVDFHWPELGLVVETDGLSYHRTPSQQVKDNRDMQAHAVAGLTAVRFSHYEIRYEGRRVGAVLSGLFRARRAAWRAKSRPLNSLH